MVRNFANNKRPASAGRSCSSYKDARAIRADQLIVQFPVGYREYLARPINNRIASLGDHKGAR